MNARKCVHAQKPYPSQAFAHESSKVGGTETGKAEADGYLGTDRLTKEGKERLTSPIATECDLLPPFPKTNALL